jgi:hypothetical protein
MAGLNEYEFTQGVIMEETHVSRTQFISFSGTPAEPASGDLRLFSQTGGSLSFGLQ